MTEAEPDLITSYAVRDTGPHDYTTDPAPFKVGQYADGFQVPVTLGDAAPAPIGYQVVVENGLDQNLSVQMLWDDVGDGTDFATIGNPVTVSAGLTVVAFSQNYPDNPVPYLGIRVTAAGTPTKGTVSAYVNIAYRP